jgi:ABC-type metal ion transport system substrate-binding protein
VPAVPQDPAERLRNLKSLLDQGLISADEYEKKRQEILKGL